MIRHSLFFRLAMMLLGLMLLVGTSYILITASAARNYFLETTQKLNSSVAEHLIHEVNPFKGGKVNEEALGTIMHSMMAVNPAIEVYLLDAKGTILSFVVLDKKVKQNTVDIAPVKQFIADKGNEFIRGDDPRNPGQKVIFSASAVRDNNTLMGYVYIVLQSEEYEHVTSALFGSYFLRIGTIGFGITLLVSFSLGLLLLYMLTKGIRKIQSGVQSFESGQYQSRIPVSGTDEMAQLATSINSMADTIMHNIDDLKQVDELRRELIANVSHDLRSPMAVIHGFVETYMMKKDTLSSEDQKKYLEAILINSEKLRKLVSDLFELSKLEAKQLALKKEPYVLNEMLHEMCEQFAVIARNKGISMEGEIPQKMPLISIDSALISRALHNLLDNAINYTGAGGSIKLSAKADDHHLHIHVSNTGAGISENDIPHIFNRYYKASNQKLQQSTGLGLAIAKRIVTLHNGDIRVKSLPGIETMFSIELPFHSNLQFSE